MSNAIRTLFASLFLLASAVIPIPVHATTQTPESSPSATDYSSRLAQLQLPAIAPSSRQLDRKIDQYIVRGGRGTELMLARMELYFPIFERYLKQHNLPLALKYLPIAESRLRARAVSPASAAGLWQLMPATARAYGLRVDRVVDERLDVNLATDAALRMLAELYAEFGNWNLVLAAYNCGPYRVKRAQAQTGSDRYEDIRRYLPSETRQYLDAYTAAAYAANYAEAHGYQARNSAWNAGELTELVVYEQLNLREAAALVGMNYADFRRLNPAFLRGYVPKNQRGYRLLIPRSSYYALGRKIWERDNLIELPRRKSAHLATELAASKGFDPYRWLMGISTEILSQHNDLHYAEYAADELVLATFPEERRLAESRP